MKKERMLVLAKAYPDLSKGYGIVLCTAGITEHGEWRRLYPIPMFKYLKHKFSKKDWIEYEIKNPKPEYRKESRKVYPDSINVVGKEDDEMVRGILNENLSDLHGLAEKFKEDKTSLGVIKPRVLDFELIKRDVEEKQKKLEEQTTLGSETIPFKIDLMDIVPKYRFHCGKRGCTLHNIMCEDIEAGMLIRRYKDNMKIGASKIKDKLFYWMRKRDLYFVMGTHFLYPNKWLIISLMYPPKTCK